MSAERAPPPRAVVAIDKRGQFVLTPEHWTISSTPGDKLEHYLSLRNAGAAADDLVFASLQRHVEGLLRAVVGERDRNGKYLVKPKDARIVFRLQYPKPKGTRKDVPREQSMCQEVLRLTLLHGLTEAAAKRAVADAFDAKLSGIDVQMVQRAYRTWRYEMPAMGDLKTYIAEYESNLRIRRFLT